MHYLPEAAQTHRDVGRGWRGVQLQVQSLMLPIEGCYSLRPDGGNVVSIMELPVKGEDPVEIQGQAAAVIHHHTQLLPLQGGGSQRRQQGSAGFLDIFSIVLHSPHDDCQKMLIKCSQRYLSHLLAGKSQPFNTF